MSTLLTRVSLLRQLSRHLVGLWTAENPIAMNLLKRILVGLKISFPPAVLTFDISSLFSQCQAGLRGEGFPF